MSKFNVGDKVKVVVAGYGIGHGDVSKDVSIVEVGRYCSEVGYRVDPPLGNSKHGGFSGERSFELVKVSAATIHKDITDAIEVLKTHGVDTYTPNPSMGRKYVLSGQTGYKTTTSLKRFLDANFPIETPAQKEKKAIEEEMRKLADRLEKLDVSSDPA